MTDLVRFKSSRFAAASAAVLASVALLTAPASQAAAIKLETYAGPKHAMNTTAWPGWIKRIGAASNGKIKVRVSYPPINPRDLLDRVREGIADMAWITHGYTTGRFVLTNMIELPGMDGNAEQMSVAYWRVYTKHFLKYNEHKGVKLLTLFTHGPGIVNTQKPVNQAADLAGMKIRTGGDTQGAIAKRLDIVTVSAPATKAQELLGRGVVDGIFFSIESITSLRLGKVLKYHYSLPAGLYTAGFAVVMNQKAYDRLSADEKAALDKVSGEPMARWIGSVWDGSDKYSVSELTKIGNVIKPFDDATAASIKKKLADLDAAWIAQAEKMGVKNADAILSELRAEVQKVKQGK